MHAAACGPLAPAASSCAARPGPLRLAFTFLCGAALYAAFMIALADFRMFAHQDKAAHALASFLLVLLLRRLLGLRPRTVAAVAVCIGGLLEMLQFFQPGRSPDMLDFLSDVLGALVAFAAVWARVRHCGGKGAAGADQGR